MYAEHYFKVRGRALATLAGIVERFDGSSHIYYKMRATTTR